LLLSAHACAKQGFQSAESSVDDRYLLLTLYHSTVCGVITAKS